MRDRNLMLVRLMQIARNWLVLRAGIKEMEQIQQKIYLVAGARPNFMKIAPIVRALKEHGGFAFKIIHTGQHYDLEMNDVFFEELGLPEPDVFMGAGGGSHSQQTARIMVAFEELMPS